MTDNNPNTPSNPESETELPDLSTLKFLAMKQAKKVSYKNYT